MFCREQVAQLRDVAPEIEALGARLAAVGNGNPAQARAFAAERRLPFALYTDSRLGSYRAAGLRRGLATTFNLDTARHAARALAGGHFQGLTQGDPWQQGGTFVVGKGGAPLALAHVAETGGDHPAPADLVAAVRSLVAG